jgi:Zn-dependent peptidase ImmA (M78 family)
MTDFRVKPRRDAEIQNIAKQARQFYGIESVEYVDILKCLKKPTIYTLAGERRLELQIVSATLMKDDQGRTTYDGQTLKIEIERSVFIGAKMGLGHARNTIAHELGHAVLHVDHLMQGVSMARKVDKVLTPGWIKTFESAEHQAKVFAPSFLINDPVADSILLVEDLALRFGISLESAIIYLDQREQEKKRKATAHHVQKKADEFRAQFAPSRNSMQFLRDPCIECGQSTVFRAGIKFMCRTCDAVYDRFKQDS